MFGRNYPDPSYKHPDLDARAAYANRYGDAESFIYEYADADVDRHTHADGNTHSHAGGGDEHAHPSGDANPRVWADHPTWDI